MLLKCYFTEKLPKYLILLGAKIELFDTDKAKALQNGECCTTVPVVKSRQQYFSDVCYALLSACLLFSAF